MKKLFLKLSRAINFSSVYSTEGKSKKKAAWFWLNAKSKDSVMEEAQSYYNLKDILINFLFYIYWIWPYFLPKETPERNMIQHTSIWILFYIIFKKKNYTNDNREEVFKYIEDLLEEEK